MGHDFAAVELVDDDHDHPEGDLHHDDHCCHGAAHLMGIHSIVSTSDMKMKSGFRVSTIDALPSLYITPLLRPPIV